MVDTHTNSVSLASSDISNRSIHVKVTAEELSGLATKLNELMAGFNLSYIFRKNGTLGTALFKNRSHPGQRPSQGSPGDFCMLPVIVKSKGTHL